MDDPWDRNEAKRRWSFRAIPSVDSVPDGVVRQDPELKQHLAIFGPTYPEIGGWRPWTGGKD